MVLIRGKGAAWLCQTVSVPQGTVFLFANVTCGEKWFLFSFHNELLNRTLQQQCGCFWREDGKAYCGLVCTHYQKRLLGRSLLVQRAFMHCFFSSGSR